MICSNYLALYKEINDKYAELKESGGFNKDGDPEQFELGLQKLKTILR
jgi:hypothetical protein